MLRDSLTRRQWMGITAGGLTAMSTHGLLNAQEESQKRPNILLLMSDQHRGDCLGADGNEAILTPHLDRIAREGARFCHAYTSVPSCTPARAALLTGLGPWRNGMLGYGKVAERYAQEKPRMLAEAGYRTCAIGSAIIIPSATAMGIINLSWMNPAGHRIPNLRVIIAHGSTPWPPVSIRMPQGSAGTTIAAGPTRFRKISIQRVGRAMWRSIILTTTPGTVRFF